MVLYRLGKELGFTVKDTCDPNPVVQIESVTSNQADLGGGQGNFTPDIVSGAHAFCIRSEREGTVPQDRTYTIKVKAQDGSGNSTTREVVVHVPHDQNAIDKCPKIDPSRIVNAVDPACKQ